MKYPHRNGETMSPSRSGKYWFQGSIPKYGDIADAVDVYGDDVYIVAGDIQRSVKAFDMIGQWWGPLTPPWEMNT